MSPGPALTPAWAAAPEPVAPSWAQASVGTEPVALTDLLALAAAAEPPGHPAGLILTDDELAGLLAQARREGAAEAAAALDAGALAALSALPEAAAAAADRNRATAEAQVRASAAELIDTALVIAAWMCGRELDADPGLVLSLAEQALADAGGTGGATMHVPAALARAAGEWADRLGLAAPELVSDPSLPAGTVTLRRGDAAGEVSVAKALARAAAALGVNAPPCPGCGQGA